MRIIVLLILLFILTVLYTTSRYNQDVREGFETCVQYTNCKSCAGASGCSWCPKENRCIYSKSLKSTDKCNQMNVINSSFSCDIKNKIIPTKPNKLYENQIENKIPPPNVYMTGTVRYTNEDVISNINNMRNDIQRFRSELPSQIAAQCGNQMTGYDPYQDLK